MSEQATLCRYCPVRGTNLECPARAFAHTKFCRQVDPTDGELFHPKMANAVLSIARGDKPVITVRAAQPERDESSPDCIEAAAAPTPTQSATVIPLDVWPKFRAALAARGCRSRDTGCGCSGYRCAEGKGRDGLVNDWDCLQCLGYIDDAGIPIAGATT